jgi:predicted O-methyltransferase YrrM
MTTQIKRAGRYLADSLGLARIELIRAEGPSWLGRTFPGRFARMRRNPGAHRIEELASRTDQRGRQPLWEGYALEGSGASRRPNDVRTSSMIGRFYTHLVTLLKPAIVVEFGAAFGVSGMYFLQGLETNGQGFMLSFEPNTVWAEIALSNLKHIGTRFELTVGTFEVNINSKIASRKIDIALIDAIHTPEFVLPQLELVFERSHGGTIILIDDIHFSQEMRVCWEKLAIDTRFSASGVVERRVGILEVQAS